MTITLERKQFFFLPDSLTLLNTSCTSVSNSTHIWLYSDYDTCGTVRKVCGFIIHNVCMCVCYQVDGSYILYVTRLMGVIFPMLPGRWELYSLCYQVDGSYILYVTR